jgi:hypothetical protein
MSDSPLVRTKERRRRKLLKTLERVKGIEPSSSAWKAVALPLSYTRELERSFSVRGPPSPSGFGGQPSHSPACQPKRRTGAKAGGGGRTRTYEGVSQRIYSPPPLPLGTLPRRRARPLAETHIWSLAGRVYGERAARCQPRQVRRPPGAASVGLIGTNRKNGCRRKPPHPPGFAQLMLRRAGRPLPQGER